MRGVCFKAMADEGPVARACGRYLTDDAAVQGGCQRRRTCENRVFAGQYLFAGGGGLDGVQINTLSCRGICGQDVAL